MADISSTWPKPSKLVILSTGLWGALWNVAFMKERLQEAGGVDAIVHSAACNTMLNSYSGVDVCGQRLAAEVRDLFDDSGGGLSDIRSVSFIGYSAGGLYVRYAIGVLHEEGFFSERGIKIDKVMSMATPHLGVRSSPRGRMGRIKNGFLGTLGNTYGGRSLEQMALTDSHAPDGNAMLLHMSLPGTRYTDALKSCERVLFYANAFNDNTVSYCSAALARRNTYRGLKDIPQLEGFPVIAGIFPISIDRDLQDNRDGGVHGDAPVQKPDGAASTKSVELAESALEKTKMDEHAAATLISHEVTGQDATSMATLDVPTLGEEMPIVRGGAGAAAVALFVSPILVMQFFTLILPLRIAHSLSTDKEVKSAARDGNDATPNTENANSLEGESSNSCLSDPALGTSGVPRASSEDVAEEAAVERPSDVGVLNSGVDGVPAEIRRNLARPELGVERVDVCLPGLHTHGTIVVRRRHVSQEGKVVIDHMAKMLFG